MPSIVQTLEQGEMWYGQDGRPYRIEEMEQSHRVNTLAFLRRRAKALQEHRTWAEQQVMNRAPDEVHSEWLRGLDEPAEQWLERRPFIVALKAAIARHDAVDGQVVGTEIERVG